MTSNIIWERIETEAIGPTQDMTATVMVPVESPWFDGHFPSFPLYPGIAQINLAVKLAVNYLQQDGGKYHLHGLKKVRFRRMVKPGDSIDFTVSPQENDRLTYRFKIETAGEITAHGTAVFRETE